MSYPAAISRRTSGGIASSFNWASASSNVMTVLAWLPRRAVFGSKALKVIDPGRAYREAAAEVEASPTVYNRMKLAEAAEELGQFGEAAQIYALCLDGPYSDDPTLLLRYAHCLVEVEQYDKALAQLEKLGELGPEGRTPAAALLLGRANEGVGNLAAADIAFDWAAERLTGMEGLARYIAFLVHQGRRAEAEEKMAILEKRFRRVPRAFRREEAKWRAQANAALSGAVATQS